MDKDYNVVDNPGNTEGGPGMLDEWVVQEYASPWRDQKAKMLLPMPFDVTPTSGNPKPTPFTMGEVPSWWLVCVQVAGDATSGANYQVNAVQGGENVGMWVIPGAGGVGLSVGGPVSRLILKGHERILGLVLPQPNANTRFFGTVWAVGAGVDPTKVGTF